MIKREKVWVDPSILDSTLKENTNEAFFVEYWLYGDEDPIEYPFDPSKLTDKLQHRGACFGSLLENIKKKPQYNRIILMLGSPKYPVITLTPEEEQRFLVLAKENGFLPEYVDVDKCLETRTLILEFTELTASELFIYLSTFRFLKEGRGIVRGVVHLVDQHGMDFYMAHVLATRVTCNNNLHNFVSAERPYGAGKNFVNKDNQIDISDAIGLKCLLANPRSYVHRPVTDPMSQDHFGVNRLIRDIFPRRTELDLQDLFDPLIKQALESTDVEEAMDLIDEYLIKVRPNIRLVEREQASDGN